MKHCQRCNTGLEENSHTERTERESEGKKYTTLRIIGMKILRGKKNEERRANLNRMEVFLT